MKIKTRINYYIGLIIILLFTSSCSLYNDLVKFTEPSEKKKSLEDSTDISTFCPDYYIPKYTNTLKSKNNIKLLKLFGVKIECKLQKDNKSKFADKIVVTQTVYYQILNKNFNLDSIKSRIFIGLVDEQNNKIKFKILSEIRPKKIIKLKNRVFV